jgi:hypothetical protein
MPMALKQTLNGVTYSSPRRRTYSSFPPLTTFTTA